MSKIVDMWGHELHKGDFIHGIDKTAEAYLGCPCVCGYKITRLNKDGSIGVEGVMNKTKGKFSEPSKFVSRSDLRYYSLEELGYEQLVFASSAYMMTGGEDGQDGDE